jgi:hypothetical protein
MVVVNSFGMIGAPRRGAFTLYRCAARACQDASAVIAVDRMRFRCTAVHTRVAREEHRFRDEKGDGGMSAVPCPDRRPPPARVIRAYAEAITSPQRRTIVPVSANPVSISAPGAGR